LQHYQKPLLNGILASHVITPEDVGKLFGPLESIRQLSRTLLPEIENQVKNWFEISWKKKKIEVL
jgi:hypothetical protein